MESDRNHETEISSPWADLFAAALTARKKAFAPHSGFLVGAAVMTGDGRVFGGANYESASYGLTM